MAFFGKKITCSYCNKPVKESYAMDVGICPHCSRRLILDSSISRPDTCNHSDGSSHEGYNYESNSTTNQASTSNVAVTPNIRSTSNTTNTTNAANTANVSSTRSTSSRRAPIDPAYIRQVNQESNLESNRNIHISTGHNRIFGLTSTNIHSEGKTIKNRRLKALSLFFVILFIVQVVSPFVSVLFHIATSDNYDEIEYSDDSYYDDFIEDDYEDGYNTVTDDNTDNGPNYYYDEAYSYLPISQILTMYLPIYYGKDEIFDITKEDLAFVKGITLTYNSSLERMYIHLYNADDTSYEGFINSSGYLDVNGLINQPNTARKGTFEVESGLMSMCLEEIIDDLWCFPNLEYIYIDQEISSCISLHNCPNITAFIAPRLYLEDNIFSNPEKIKYLSVYEITNWEAADVFTNLKAIKFSNKYYMRDALEVIYKNNPSVKDLNFEIISTTY